MKIESKHGHHAALSVHLILTMGMLVAGTILFCGILNTTLLEPYYAYNKQKELVRGYAEMNNAAAAGVLDSDEFDIPFERICTNGNINILIIGQDRNAGTILRSSSSNAQQLMLELYDMMFGMNQTDAEVIVHNQNYVMERLPDHRMQSEYLVLYGNLQDGSYVYMRTAIESIRESVTVTNRFFLMVGAAALLISVAVIIFVSKSVSRPIMELSELSRRMCGLEFDAKYQGKRRTAREIEQLGNHMNELSQTLERTISELKAANNELKNDIRKKEQIDEIRKEFLSNVSHELKTPLALIQGYAEGLKEGINEDQESRDFYCDVIVDESAKMNQMVQKLLTLNRLEFGNDIVEMERFDIADLIKGAIQASRLLAQQDDIEIACGIAAPCYVWGDEFQVEEVIMNYLSNAIHYAQGPKRVEVTGMEHDGLFRVSVYNTGKQIPEEELNKIWIKFYKIDKARTREYGGSGIGLSIVKAIMESMHQRCGVINREGGVEFWFELEKG